MAPRSPAPRLVKNVAFPGSPVPFFAASVLCRDADGALSRGPEGAHGRF